MSEQAVAVEAPSEGAGLDMDAVIQDAVAQSIPPQSDPDRPRDEKGRFVKQGEDAEPSEDGEPESPADAVAEDATEDAAASEAPTPEEVAELRAPVVKDRPLATEFKVKVGDADAPIPDLMVEFKAAGKDRVEPLDKVVKLAQQGVYQHEREQRLQQIERQAQVTQQEAQTYKGRAEELETALEALLSDPDRYLSAKELYDREQTPERQLARLAEERAAWEQERQVQAMAQQGTAFFEQRLMPAMEQIASALPLVDTEELSARVMLEVQPYRDPHTGLVPPTHYATVEQALLERVVPWAQYRHELLQSRLDASVAPARAEAAKAASDVKAAQVAAQKAKNTVARAVAPAKAVASPSAPKPKPIVTADDGVNASVQEAVRAAMGLSA